MVGTPFSWLLGHYLSNTPSELGSSRFQSHLGGGFLIDRELHEDRDAPSITISPALGTQQVFR